MRNAIYTVHKFCQSSPTKTFFYLFFLSLLHIYYIITQKIKKKRSKKFLPPKYNHHNKMIGVTQKPTPPKQKKPLSLSPSNSSSSSQQLQQQQQLDDPISDHLENSFMERCCLKQQKNHHQNLHHFVFEIPYSVDLMFIVFSFYQDEITLIAKKFQCKSKISLNKIRIISTNSQQDTKSCSEQICPYIKKIVFLQLSHEKKNNIIYSPYFNIKAKQSGFNMCKFNHKIYCHSNIMDSKYLQQSIKNVFAGQNIFVINIKSLKSKQSEIYNHYRSFIKHMIKQQNKQEFEKREVVVQIDASENNLHCIGKRERDLVAAKNIMKNLLQSIVILIVKFENQQRNQRISELRQYIKKKSNFPIIVAKVQKRSLTIISKQNVIRKFLQQPTIFQILNTKQKPEIGMFLPRRYNYNQRKHMIQNICLTKGYDFTTLGGLYYFFKKVFIHENQQVDPKQIFLLINQILQQIKQNKPKFEIPSNHRLKIQQKIQIQFTGDYYSKGNPILDTTLTKQLKRDVLRESVTMAKDPFVRYQVCDALESDVVFWFLNKNKDNQKTICEKKDMKKGVQYFSGKFKKKGKQHMYFFIQYKYQLL